jgi:hypothetical protein
MRSGERTCWPAMLKAPARVNCQNVDKVPRNPGLPDQPPEAFAAATSRPVALSKP